VSFALLIAIISFSFLMGWLAGYFHAHRAEPQGVAPYETFLFGLIFLVSLTVSITLWAVK
jgi:hypothetical protein